MHVQFEAIFMCHIGALMVVFNTAAESFATRISEIFRSGISCRSGGDRGVQLQQAIVGDKIAMGKSLFLGRR